MPAAVRIVIGPARMPTRRTYDEQLALRWPRLVPLVSRPLLALPPGSGVRSAFFRRNALAGWGAWLRGDFEAMAIRLSPAFEYEPPREWVAVGMREVYRGHAGLREWSADMHEAWEWIENMPLEIVDAGDPVVFVNSIRIRARGSGLEFAYRSALVCWFERGLIVRERDYLDADEALPALGIAVRP